MRTSGFPRAKSQLSQLAFHPLPKNGEVSLCWHYLRWKEGLLRSQVPLHCSLLPTHLQVFDNTPAALDGTVAAGDEITGVNGRSIKGKTKVEVAKMIQEVKVRWLWEQLEYETQAVRSLLSHPGCRGPSRFRVHCLLLTYIAL